VAALYGPNHPDISWDIRLPGHPVSALWDGDMVKRALINYVDNAIAALEGRAPGAAAEDRLAVPKGTIQLALFEEGENLRFDVVDGGAGVPEPDRERLFDPYFSTKRKGTGLGLAIVRRIAQDHGGDARYEPLDPGSRFSLILPKAGRH
jgi:two-component system nitrogen regulation sensor histidine kinase NtrY